ncbi:MAG: phosphatase PAP2 family protein [Lachnospiraceae bacterium]|nr:phosphatase PAP2 family protein [Candidatus Equihabitans merdae]
MSFFKKVKQIPWWGYALGVLYFALQYAMYRFGDFLSQVIGTKANAWCPKIPFIDDMIGVVPFFVVFYIFSYVFWICAPMAVSLTKRSHFLNYIIGLSAAYIVGFLIFTFFPSYMDRAAEGLLNFTSNGGLFETLLAGIYSSDGGTMAFNMCPSYHCLISLYCYLGVHGQPEISKGFKIYSAVMAILIWLSTMLTKQHYFLDTVVGISIALICYLVVKAINPGEKIMAKRA